jgi:hypothetical protein
MGVGAPFVGALPRIGWWCQPLLAPPLGGLVPTCRAVMNEGRKL